MNDGTSLDQGFIAGAGRQDAAPACVPPGADNRPGSIIDVRDLRKIPIFRPRFVFGTVGAGVVGFVLWMALLGASTGIAGMGGAACFVTLTVVLASGAVALILEHRATLREKARNLATQVDLSAIGQAMSDSLAKVRTEFSWHFLTTFVDQLVECGRFGDTIRVQRTDEVEPLEPIAVPFEPQQFGRTETPLFTADRSDASDRVDSRSAQARAKQRKTRRARLTADWLGRFGLVYALFLACREIYRSLVAGYPTRMLLFWLVFFTIASIGVWIYRAYRENQWFVVPGGLVLRRSGWSSDKWSVHLYTRQRAVLLAYQERDRVWQILVADEDERGTLNGNEEQVVHALRAWLSPLPPPPVEQLSDLL